MRITAWVEEVSDAVLPPPKPEQVALRWAQQLAVTLAASFGAQQEPRLSLVESGRGEVPEPSAPSIALGVRGLCNQWEEMRFPAHSSTPSVQANRQASARRLEWRFLPVEQRQSVIEALELQLALAPCGSKKRTLLRLLRELVRELAYLHRPSSAS